MVAKKKVSKAKPRLVKNKKTNKRYILYNKKKYMVQSTGTDRYLIKNLFTILNKILDSKRKRRIGTKSKKFTNSEHKQPTATGSAYTAQKIHDYKVSDDAINKSTAEYKKLIKKLEKAEAKRIEPTKKEESNDTESINQTKNEKLVHRIKDAERRLTDIQSETKDSEKVKEDLENIINELHHNQKDLDKEISTLINQRDNVREELVKLIADYDVLKENYHKILEEKEELTTKIKNIQHTIFELEEKGKEKQLEVEFLSNNLEHLREELYHKEKELEDSKNILFDINSELTKKKNRLDKANQQISELKIEKNNLIQNITEADEDFLILKEKSSKIIKEQAFTHLNKLITEEMLKKILTKFKLGVKENYNDSLNKISNLVAISKLPNGAGNYINELLDDRDVGKMTPHFFIKRFNDDMKTPEKFNNKKQVVETPIPAEKRKEQKGYLKPTASSSKRSNITPIPLKHLSKSPPNSPVSESLDELSDINIESDELPYVHPIEDDPTLKLTRTDGDIEGNGLSNTQKGLWDYEISDLMKKYSKYGFVGVYSVDNLSKVPVNPNKESMSFVMNTMPSTVKLGHWISIYLTKHNLEYYDSLAQPPSELFLQNIKPILRKWTDNPLQFKINRIKTQSMKSDNCGWYAMNFLLKRYKGESFKEITGYNRMMGVIKSEKAIKVFKKKFSLPDFGMI